MGVRKMRWSSFFVVFALLTAGCTTIPANQPVADAGLDAKFKTFKARSGFGTLYLYTGITKNPPSAFGSRENPYGAPVDFYINGHYIGGVNKDEYFGLTLKPGSYSIVWKEHGGSDISSDSYTINVHGGENYFIRNVFDTGAGAYLGLLSVLTFKHYLESAPGTGHQDVQSRKLVVANEFAGSVAPTMTVSPLKANLTNKAPVNKNTASNSLKNRLRKLKSLFNDGVITNGEYDEKRKALLDEL